MQEPVMLDITVSRREKLLEYVIHSAEPDPIDAIPCLTVNGIDDIIISCRSCVISQSRAKVSAGFTIVSCLAVAAFDLVYCSLSVFRFVFVPDINKQSSQSSDQLWATRHIQRGAGIRAIVSDVQPKI